MDEEEKLKRDNEIRKLKLSAFKDAQFFKNPDAELPPEVESEWLDNIEAFEEKFENCSQISVYEKLERPSFTSVEELDDDEIESKLNELLRHMTDYGIHLDTICEVPDKELYRFITEELFDEMIDDIQVEGMVTGFIYEEFHPNDELDIEQRLRDFISEMFNPFFQQYLDMHFAEVCRSRDGTEIMKNEVVKKVLRFATLFEEVTVESLDSIDITLVDDEMNATVTFNLAYTTRLNNDIQSYDGSGKTTIKKSESGYWEIITFSMPGFSL